MASHDLLIIGSTGLVGKEILKNLNTSPELASRVYSLTRREVPDFKPSSHVEELVEKDISKWTETLGALSSVHTLVSGLGTTKAAAGGLKNQYKIDHDLNFKIAKFSKEKLNCDTYLLISSTAASSNSRFPYLKMKGELEDHVKELKFNKTIILQPGLLIGERERSKGFGASIFEGIGSFAKDRLGYRVGSAVTGEEVAAVATKLLKDSASYDNGTVKTLDASEIIKIIHDLKK